MGHFFDLFLKSTGFHASVYRILITRKLGDSSSVLSNEELTVSVNKLIHIYTNGCTHVQKTVNHFIVYKIILKIPVFIWIKEM
jgi:hypothetical protein